MIKPWIYNRINLLAYNSSGSLNPLPGISKLFSLNLDGFKLSKTKCIAKDELPHCFPFAL